MTKRLAAILLSLTITAAVAPVYADQAAQQPAKCGNCPKEAKAAKDCPPEHCKKADVKKKCPKCAEQAQAQPAQQAQKTAAADVKPCCNKDAQKK